MTALELAGGISSKRRKKPVTVHVKFQETFPLRASEWGLSFMMFSWGLIVSLNPGMFAANPNFIGMSVLMSQSLWGLLATAIGAVGIIALGINGFWRATPFIRAVCAFLRCGVWLTIVLGFFISDKATTGLAVYPVIFLMDMWNIYRATSDARQVV